MIKNFSNRFLPNLFKFSRKFSTFNQLEIDSLLLQPNPLLNIIKEMITMNQGELKFNKYWQYSLTHPQYGYYQQKSAFSKSGDFTTSPEISPLFGQIFGIWIIHFISQLAKNDSNSQETDLLTFKPFKLIELGPGRGLFMNDIIRTLGELKLLPFLRSVTMIEASNLNIQTQQDNVINQLKKHDIHFKYSYQLKNKQIFVGEDQNMKLRWFKTIQEMQLHDVAQNQDSNQPVVILAHQFFDALPTTPLVYTQKGWKEKVVKWNENTRQITLESSSLQMNAKLMPKVSNPQIGDTIQISYQSLLLIENLSRIIEKSNGAIVNVDYGNSFAHSHSIRAIKDHKYVPFPYWLQMPGLCDISAYVDFASLSDYAKKVPNIRNYQILPQGYFLQAMGINVRMEILMKNMDTQRKQRLESQYQRLTHPDQMGEIYKVQVITKKENGEIFPFIQQSSNVF